MSKKKRRRLGPKLVIDRLHEQAIEAAMVIDREHHERGEYRWLRPLIDHEFCPGSCPAWPAGTVMSVIVMGDGMRIRRPIVSSIVGRA